MKKPLYVLPHGIEVVGEYAPNAKCPYWRVRIRPHPLFRAVNVSGGLYVRRNRAVMTSILGRALSRNEHVHHKNEDRSDDSPDNLELISPAEHNRHHKFGTRHSAETRQRISLGLKSAIAEGRRQPPPRIDWTGRKHSEESKRKMSETTRRQYENGLEKPKPPSFEGRRHSADTKARMSDSVRYRRRHQDGRFA